MVNLTNEFPIAIETQTRKVFSVSFSCSPQSIISSLNGSNVCDIQHGIAANERECNRKEYTRFRIYTVSRIKIFPFENDQIQCCLPNGFRFEIENRFLRLKINNDKNRINVWCGVINIWSIWFDCRLLSIADYRPNKIKWLMCD